VNVATIGLLRVALQQPVSLPPQADSFRTGRRSTRVEIDPEQVLPDVRRENNVWARPP